MDIKTMQKILDGAPEGLTHVKLLFGLPVYYQLSSSDDADQAALWVDSGNDSYWGLSSYQNWELLLESNCFVSITDLRTGLAKHDTLDLEPADIPHGCIVLEK